MKGKVKWYDMRKGYGFIVGDDEKDYFVHFSSLERQSDVIKEGEVVNFETKKTDRGLQAVNVKRGE